MQIVINADSADVMECLDASLFDFAFCDPPYGIKSSAKHMSVIQRPEGGTFSGVTDEWDDLGTMQDQIEFIADYVDWVNFLLKPNGTAVFMGTYHNMYHLGHILLMNKWFILNDGKWIKANPAPNFLGARFTSATESFIWARKDGKGKYYFDYQGVKALNGGKQMRNDIHIDPQEEWNVYLPICAGNERLKVEDPTTKSGYRALHQTQKPKRLLEIFITACCPSDGWIVDLFGGSGTTVLVAAELGRHTLIVEKDEMYAQTICKRLEEGQYEYIYLSSADVDRVRDTHEPYRIGNTNIILFYPDSTHHIDTGYIPPFRDVFNTGSA